MAPQNQGARLGRVQRGAGCRPRGVAGSCSEVRSGWLSSRIRGQVEVVHLSSSMFREEGVRSFLVELSELEHRSPPCPGIRPLSETPFGRNLGLALPPPMQVVQRTAPGQAPKQDFRICPERDRRAGLLRGVRGRPSASVVAALASASALGSRILDIMAVRRESRCRKSGGGCGRARPRRPLASHLSFHGCSRRGAVAKHPRASSGGRQSQGRPWPPEQWSRGNPSM